ncbi:MAG TPA: hydrogenase expression/formation protein HypE [Pyrinomonadaceae bacterium]|nr:hydrogenase expression/formation protein HypE [Pyrinomonadaceae bacterium]
MNDLDFNAWTCPLPLRDYPKIVLGHGGGGKLGNELVENLFLPVFSNESLDKLSDSAQLDVAEMLKDGGRLAYSTDSFVVQPLFFRGGNIGHLAVCGTVNDVAMSGAKPLFLSAGFIIEEGFEIESLGKIVNSMGEVSRNANVKIVTGDTKVVNKGKGDGLFINTSGIGIIPKDVNISPNLAAIGDVVILSGEIGLHGIAIMSEREGLEFDAPIESDCANLNFLVDDMLSVTKEIHVLRDPTRGGIASALNEIAKAANVGIRIYDEKIPVPNIVRGACEMLGLDPFYVANEGKLLAILPREHAEEVLAKMQQNEYGQKAVIIGEVVAEHPQMVVAKTAFGSTRVVDLQLGEQLPRIC